MLEAVGTLRLTQERFADAIEIYLKSEQLNPVSLITLNNLAVSLSETRGREHEALSRAERVVQLYGRNAELLDTLGVALLRAGKLNEAQQVLREAIELTSDSRHQFHLIQVLYAMDRTDDARQMWKELDQKAIDREHLTPIDRIQLDRISEALAISDAA